jgi:hypothetical protein
LAETHGQRGELTEDRHKFILQSVKEMVQERGERQQELQAAEGSESQLEPDSDSSPANATDRSGLGVLCLPARHEADEIAGMMLSQLAEPKRWLVQAVPVASVASELVDLVRQRNVDVVCISAMPPAAVMHARYLCRRLRGRFPKVQLVVGLWNAPSDLDKAKERIACGAAVHVVATLADAQEQIRLLIEPLVPRSEKHVTLDCDPLVAEGACPPSQV